MRLHRLTARLSGMHRIYLDHHATTPTDPRVVEAMQPFFTNTFGNPHSDGHRFGWEAHDAVEQARADVAALIGADAREIVFTSGATESCNLALRGAARACRLGRDDAETAATADGRAEAGPGQPGGARIDVETSDPLRDRPGCTAAPAGDRATAAPRRNRRVRSRPSVPAGDHATAAPADRRRIVTAATEHPAVLDTCTALRNDGFEPVVLPVDRDGLIDLDAVRRAVDTRTLLVSIMLANNEIGVLQPMAPIAAICRAAGALLHTDATQAVGRIPVDVRALDVDFLSCSAHKLYGPNGIGALFTRWAAADALAPLTTGGGQERGLRPGTVAAPLAVGFGAACRIAAAELDRDRTHTRRLADALLSRLRSRAPDLHLFGHPDRRLPGSLSVGFPGVAGDDIVERVGDRLAVSTGSACASGSATPSHVLAALDPTGGAAYMGVRIGIGRFNREDEIEAAADLLTAAAGR